MKAENQLSEIAADLKARKAGASKNLICSENQGEIRVTLIKQIKWFGLIVRTGKVTIK